MVEILKDVMPFLIFLVILLSFLLNIWTTKKAREEREKMLREHEKLSEALRTMTEELKYARGERKEFVKALRKTGKEHHQE
uniref:Uncharacterized protein n=1 Tax=Candidatus Kentrum sp. DK TaxID=2126562 RepID=A0A450SW43_9GAMM|nr:MAG: hypothetical protein BECKDK2373C_GA0170839_10649 [Candidatus Kentron sp. DK]